ncbi:MAG: hypothetical protein ACI8Z1_001649 [Candidatus Azotimanducaceae bacterium]|jgi:uncharacterized protein (DUF1499 family)
MKTIALLLTTLLLASCASQPNNPENSELAPCPIFPGCAATTWTPSGPQEDAWQAIIDYAKTHSSLTIVAQTDDYLHVEARTPTVGFVDDVRFRHKSDGTIAARSSSRLGISDLGANRARLDRIVNSVPEITATD